MPSNDPKTAGAYGPDGGYYEDDYDPRDDYEPDGPDLPECAETDDYSHFTTQAGKAALKFSKKVIGPLKQMGWKVVGVEGCDDVCDEYIEEGREGWEGALAYITLAGKAGQKIRVSKNNAIVLDRNVKFEFWLWAALDTEEQEITFGTGRYDGDGWNEPREEIEGYANIECPGEKIRAVAFSFEDEGQPFQKKWFSPSQVPKMLELFGKAFPKELRIRSKVKKWAAPLQDMARLQKSLLDMVTLLEQMDDAAEKVSKIAKSNERLWGALWAGGGGAYAEAERLRLGTLATTINSGGAIDLRQRLGNLSSLDVEDRIDHLKKVWGEIGDFLRHADKTRLASASDVARRHQARRLAARVVDRHMSRTASARVSSRFLDNKAADHLNDGTELLTIGPREIIKALPRGTVDTKNIAIAKKALSEAKNGQWQVAERTLQGMERHFHGLEGKFGPVSGLVYNFSMVLKHHQPEANPKAQTVGLKILTKILKGLEAGYPNGAGLKILRKRANAGERFLQGRVDAGIKARYTGKD